MRYVLYISFVFLIISCTKNEIVFPEGSQATAPELSNRAPVKQTQFKVVSTNGRVKFELGDVDTDKIAALFFSYNKDGEKIDTEITDLTSDYIITNLPLETNIAVDVWAKGKNGLLSDKAVYTVYTLPSSAIVISRNVVFMKKYLQYVQLSVLNSTENNAVFHYKSDIESTFRTRALSAASGSQVFTFEVPAGTSTINYYVSDQEGNETAVLSTPFVSDPITLFTTKALKTGWTATVSSNHEGDGGGASALIDGDVETFWHTPWSGTILPWPHYATITFDKEKYLTKVILNIRHNNGTGAPGDFDLMISSNGTNFSTYQTYKNTSTTARAQVEFEIATPVRTKYVRLSFKNGINNYAYMSLGEIGFGGYTIE